MKNLLTFGLQCETKRKPRKEKSGIKLTGTERAVRWWKQHTLTRLQRMVVK